MKRDMKKSLQHLKKYISSECLALLGKSETVDILIERLDHAIDHVISDHCEGEEE